MKRARIGVIAAAVLAVATVAFAQKPDFSGTWQIDPEASGMAGGGGGRMGGGPMTVGTSSPGGPMGAYPGGSHFLLHPTRSQTTAVESLPPYLTVVFCQKQ